MPSHSLCYFLTSFSDVFGFFSLIIFFSWRRSFGLSAMQISPFLRPVFPPVSFISSSCPILHGQVIFFSYNVSFCQQVLDDPVLGLRPLPHPVWLPQGLGGAEVVCSTVQSVVRVSQCAHGPRSTYVCSSRVSSSAIPRQQRPTLANIGHHRPSYSDQHRSATVSNGQQRSTMVSNGQQWSATVNNGQLRPARTPPLDIVFVCHT